MCRIIGSTSHTVTTRNVTIALVAAHECDMQMLIHAKRACYFLRRGRRFSYGSNWEVNDILCKTGLRNLWCSLVWDMHKGWMELHLAVYASLCVFAAPIFFFLVGAKAFGKYMRIGFREVMRCTCEAILLYSMWQGKDTSVVGLVAYCCWTLGLHCDSVTSCRVCTWLAVCLVQVSYLMEGHSAASFVLNKC